MTAERRTTDLTALVNEAYVLYTTIQKKNRKKAGTAQEIRDLLAQFGPKAAPFISATILVGRREDNHGTRLYHYIPLTNSITATTLDRHGEPLSPVPADEGWDWAKRGSTIAMAMRGELTSLTLAQAPGPAVN